MNVLQTNALRLRLRAMAHQARLIVSVFGNELDAAADDQPTHFRVCCGIGVQQLDLILRRLEIAAPRLGEVELTKAKLAIGLLQEARQALLAGFLAEPALDAAAAEPDPSR